MQLVLALSVAFGVSAETAQAPGQLAIQESRFQSIGGVDQWITIRGEDARNPVLFLLHGGPGDVQSQFVETYHPLEKDFVVVQWDQRGAGRTLAKAGLQQRTSLEQLTSDGLELADYLRMYLRTSDLTLVGHSWGSFLGVEIVKRRPDAFRAFVGVGQVVRWSDMVAAQYRFTLDQARTHDSHTAVTELERLGMPSPENFEQYLVMRKFLNGYLAEADRRWLAGQDRLLRTTLAGQELAAYWQGFQTMSGMSATVFSMDLPSLGTEFKLPVFVIDGADDRIAPADLAAAYLERIQAPVKRFSTIKGAGHFALMTHANEFVAELHNDLRLVPR
jgi:pimeloyl-ACP methyl ester carboxylesterase